MSSISRRRLPAAGRSTPVQPRASSLWRALSSFFGGMAIISETAVRHHYDAPWKRYADPDRPLNVRDGED